MLFGYKFFLTFDHVSNVELIPGPDWPGMPGCDRIPGHYDKNRSGPLINLWAIFYLKNSNTSTIITPWIREYYNKTPAIKTTDIIILS
jgi:hypothetical protein